MWVKNCAVEVVSLGVVDTYCLWYLAHSTAVASGLSKTGPDSTVVQLLLAVGLNLRVEEGKHLALHFFF